MSCQCCINSLLAAFHTPKILDINVSHIITVVDCFFMEWIHMPILKTLLFFFFFLSCIVSSSNKWEVGQLHLKGFAKKGFPLFVPLLCVSGLRLRLHPAPSRGPHTPGSTAGPARFAMPTVQIFEGPRALFPQRTSDCFTVLT